MGLSAMSNWTFNTVVIFSFPLLEKSLGIEYTFALYAVICFLGLIYTYFYMPETKGLSLEQIENYVMTGKPLRYLGSQNALNTHNLGQKERTALVSTH